MFVRFKENLTGLKFVKNISDYNITFRNFPHILPVQDRWWEYQINSEHLKKAKILRKQS